LGSKPAPLLAAGEHVLPLRKCTEAALAVHDIRKVGLLEDLEQLGVGPAALPHLCHTCPGERRNQHTGRTKSSRTGIAHRNSHRTWNSTPKTAKTAKTAKTRDGLQTY